ncbi:hypothetical protein [Shewanella algae]|uniref:hypothetical protein n=1 Tax=Shewanella algae TaxID=38313 RepID=UPI00131FFE53|nr:hypothetical protein [Shewanella algae]MBC8797989.1 hypothetical protein [Shewanella algae]QHD53452.1 hypothetical protein GM320_09980 [Shewanella algae]
MSELLLQSMLSSLLMDKIEKKRRKFDIKFDFLERKAVIQGLSLKAYKVKTEPVGLGNPS